MTTRKRRPPDRLFLVVFVFFYDRRGSVARTHAYVKYDVELVADGVVIIAVGIAQLLVRPVIPVADYLISPIVELDKRNVGGVIDNGKVDHVISRVKAYLAAGAVLIGFERPAGKSL